MNNKSKRRALAASVAALLSHQVEARPTGVDAVMAHLHTPAGDKLAIAKLAKAEHDIDILVQQVIHPEAEQHDHAELERLIAEATKEDLAAAQKRQGRNMKGSAKAAPQKLKLDMNFKPIEAKASIQQPKARVSYSGVTGDTQRLSEEEQLAATRDYAIKRKPKGRNL